MRAFVGVGITDRSVTGAIAEFQGGAGIGGAGIGGSPVRPENLHITLQFLGEVAESASRGILAALDTVRFEAFDVALRGAGTFPDRGPPRVVWVGAGGAGGRMLARLAGEVGDALAPLGFAPDGRFRPHVTVFRIGRGGGDADTIIRRLDPHRTREFGVQRVTGISLKRSWLRPGGAVYTDVARPAAGAAGPG